MQHIEDTVCAYCLRRVLCHRIDCLECDQAIQLLTSGIVDGSLDRGEASKCWSPSETKDIIYHELVVKGKLPAVSNSRFPVHRLSDQRGYKDIWGGQSFPRSKAASSIRANSTYNATRCCRQCKSSHTYLCRKLIAAYYLPKEMKYDDIVHTREPGRLVPKMLIDFREDE